MSVDSLQDVLKVGPSTTQCIPCQYAPTLLTSNPPKPLKVSSIVQLRLEFRIGLTMVSSMTSMANPTNATTTSNSTSNPALLLDGDVAAATVVTVHPLVLLSVLDHHTRRQEPNGRVIGTLLGRRNGNMVRWCCFCINMARPDSTVL